MTKNNQGLVDSLNINTKNYLVAGAVIGGLASVALGCDEVMKNYNLSFMQLLPKGYDFLVSGGLEVVEKVGLVLASSLVGGVIGIGASQLEEFLFNVTTGHQHLPKVESMNGDWHEINNKDRGVSEGQNEN
jgi:hypothetical protein